ncbi:MAG: cobalamin-dependent protein [Deltaproteobacteria bacterium]|nr:cobalamin-dependent protein [Deltaproteobacteria bacterium]MBW2052841.1 cobalamin-dependent protein [Deltaproteobacteria bacterium]MBW2142157.1 cobalamin-dependent protein [Deltaproteobacteria bacterium]
MNEGQAYRPENHIRVITATSLFDGHDAAINIMRRILQGTGAEVIHLGHNRPAVEIVTAAVQEDAQAIAVSSYQGGHVEFFKYIVDLLKERDSSHIKVFGGGGGVIVPDEIREIEAYGVTKIYSPEDGRQMGLQGMINHLMASADQALKTDHVIEKVSELDPRNINLVARLITMVENAKEKDNGRFLDELLRALHKKQNRRVPVLGLTGTGGAGKSSLMDEIVIRFLNDFEDQNVAILSVDPSRRKTGGALLGDRIRMNALGRNRLYMRSLATRSAEKEVSPALGESIEVLKAAGFDLIIVETTGIGQGDAAVVPFVDKSLYVMTAEYGAPSQLEKIDMLDFADLVTINKFDRKGAKDALRDVRKQYQRNHNLFELNLEEMPVYGTIAAKFNDDGVTALYQTILDGLKEHTGHAWESSYPRPENKVSSSQVIIIPPERGRYLSEIAETVRSYHDWVEEQAELVQRVWQIEGSLEVLVEEGDAQPELIEALERKRFLLDDQLDTGCRSLLAEFEILKGKYAADEFVYSVRDQEFRTPLYSESLSGSRVPRVALPSFKNPGDLLKWLLLENVPGGFPYTAGVFPFKRLDEEPTRMFAGEGDPARTNRRFKYLSEGSEAKRLSTAFDSVTLYGQDPDARPDVYGKVGTSGVSICTLDDVKVLYQGFDLAAPNTSVSMTINGPAPIMLAMFFNAALDQQVDKFKTETGRLPDHEEKQRIRSETLREVRGTVQADILKEDQGQNTCIFSIEFALKMMGDIQAYFIENDIRNFYSVSISGYHIAEAGANPITQCAFTLANGFSYVEYYLSRGMRIDDFAPNLSFFFSNGMDPEYAVINRVARRIWAIAMRNKYGADERSQKLKAHVQTSGRSLHSQEIQFNDIRTTLQALTALYDNCNSLHTNSYDEAVTTPTEESVRRALAIQMIINKEFGLYKNENPAQGSFIIEELTRLVEEAVLMEFDRLSERGGVLGAMETGYQRSKIQEESLFYESKKMSGELPIIGVNTFLDPQADLESQTGGLELARATEEEKASQLKRLNDFKARHKDEAPRALKCLKQAVLSEENIFAELMETVRSCSLGQITKALYDVGGQYRRNM